MNEERNRPKFMFFNNKIEKKYPKIPDKFSSVIHTYSSNVNEEDYIKARENLEQIISKLSLIDFCLCISNFIYHLVGDTRQILYFINLRLKFEEPSQPVEFSEKIYIDILKKLTYCFIYLLKNISKNIKKDGDKDVLMQNILRLQTSQIYIKEFSGIEKIFIKNIFNPYLQQIQTYLELTLSQIISFLDTCIYLVFCKSQNITREKGLIKERPYLLNVNEIILESKKKISEKNKEINELTIKKIIKHFGCQFGVESEDISTLYENTIFSEKLFIFNNKTNLIFFPAFTNIYKKLFNRLKNIIKKEYPKFWTKFNQKYSNFLEEKTQELFESLFESKYYKGIFIDGIHETDGLIQYRDYLFIIECKKTEMRESSKRGGLESYKTDVKNILKGAMDQLFHRKKYVENKPIIELFDSNKNNKKKVGEIKIKDISKILYISVTFEDIAVVLGQKYYFPELKLNYNSEDLVTISIKSLILLSSMLAHPILFLHYLFLRNHFIINSGNIILFYEEIDLLGVYFKDLLSIEYYHELIAFTDIGADIREFIFIDHLRDINPLEKFNPAYYRYKKFFYFMNSLINFDKKNLIDLALYLLSLQPEEIQQVNNYLVRFLRKGYKFKKEPKIILFSLPEFKVLIILSLYKDNIKEYNYNKVIKNPPKELMTPSMGFKKIFILELNKILSDIKIKLIQQ